MRDVTKIFVAGDLMLDRFEYGKVSRISPEAPVPIFRHEREKRMLGGVFELCRQAQELGYLIVVISNQSGVSRGYYTEAQMNACNAHMCAEFAKRGITVILLDSTHALSGIDLTSVEKREDSFR